jgi:hypothetical protein
LAAANAKAGDNRSAWKWAALIICNECGTATNKRFFSFRCTSLFVARYSNNVAIMKQADFVAQNRRTLMILLSVLVTLVIITVMTVLVKN